MDYATIDGFELLSPQEVFDISSKHLLKQNSKSLNFSQTCCKYRGEKGKMCAAGPFLKDEQVGVCEGSGWATLRGRDIVPQKNGDLIEGLQFIHDAEDPAQWRELLTKLAADYGLVCKF